MKLIAVSGIKGGVGAATVAANLTGAFHRLNKRVGVVDLDTRNVIRLFFSMAMSDRDGWAVRVKKSQDWALACHKSPEGVFFLPFGELNLLAGDRCNDSNAPFRLDTESGYRLSDSVFSEMLSTLRTSFDYLILHLPPLAYSTGISQYLDSLHSSVDLHLAVVNPEPSCNLMLHSMRSAFRRFPKLHLLSNKANLSSKVSADFSFHMSQECGDFLISNPVHYDEALAEATANLQTIDCYSPYSQSASDFRSLALWCIANLNRADNG